MTPSPDYPKAMKTPQHPDRDRIALSDVLDALSDPTRRTMVRMLAECTEANCKSFEMLGAKTNLTYHLTRLREAGVINVRPEGTMRFITLRLDDLEARFPGLMTAVIEAERRSGEG
jgi:DNA-binding transcriptional ArsR family regulator